MSTSFPYAGNVAISLHLADKTVSSVAVKLRIRMPSWLNSSVRVAVNGNLHGHGEPASYYLIDRQWRESDTVSFTLPTIYRVSQYTGVEQVHGYEGKRFALQVGPIVLACVGPMDAGDTTVLPVAAGSVEDWLVPTSQPLHFNIKGAPNFHFKPLWDVSQGEKFTVYPILGGSSSELLV